MKILLIPAGIVALAVTTTGKACMGKWDRIIQRDSSIISSVTTPTPTPTPAPAATSTATPTPTPTASASPGKAKDAQA